MKTIKIVRNNLRKTVSKRKSRGGSKTPSLKSKSHSMDIENEYEDIYPFVIKNGPHGYEPPRLPPFSVTGQDKSMIQGRRIQAAKKALVKAFSTNTIKNINAAYIAVHNTTELGIRVNWNKEVLINGDTSKTGNERFELGSIVVWGINDNGDITIPTKYA